MALSCPPTSAARKPLARGARASISPPPARPVYLRNSRRDHDTSCSRPADSHERPASALSSAACARPSPDSREVPESAGEAAGGTTVRLSTVAMRANPSFHARRHHFRSAVNGCPDALIGSATAEVATHRGINVRIARIGFLPQKRRSRHQLPSLAVAALRHVELDPCPL